MIKRQKITPGSILRIPLNDGTYAFGRLFPTTTVAVYDIKSVNATVEEIGGIDKIISRPYLFYVSVYKDAITKGFFEVLEVIPVTKEEEERIPPVYTQDIINIHDCTLYYHDGRVVKARPEDCIGLEDFSVWEADAVRQRIEDHFAGRENFYANQSKVRLK